MIIWNIFELLKVGLGQTWDNRVMCKKCICKDRRKWIN